MTYVFNQELVLGYHDICDLIAGKTVHTLGLEISLGVTNEDIINALTSYEAQRVRMLRQKDRVVPRRAPIEPVQYKIFELYDFDAKYPAIAIQIRQSAGISWEANRLSKVYNIQGTTLIDLNSGEAHNNWHNWKSPRPFPAAHIYIHRMWRQLQSGDIIDIQFLYRETDKPRGKFGRNHHWSDYYQEAKTRKVNLQGGNDKDPIF